jgi:hypothetical protein
MDVGGVPRFLGDAADLQNTGVEVGHLDLRHTIGGGAVPAVANGLGAVASFFALKGVVEDERATGPEPSGVVGRECGERSDHERDKGESHWRAAGVLWLKVTFHREGRFGHSSEMARRATRRG